jgi:hypothetical protein
MVDNKKKTGIYFSGRGLPGSRQQVQRGARRGGRCQHHEGDQPEELLRRH